MNKNNFAFCIAKSCSDFGVAWKWGFILHMVLSTVRKDSCEHPTKVVDDCVINYITKDNITGKLTVKLKRDMKPQRCIKYIQDFDIHILSGIKS